MSWNVKKLIVFLWRDEELIFWGGGHGEGRKVEGVRRKPKT